MFASLFDVAISFPIVATGFVEKGHCEEAAGCCDAQRHEELVRAQAAQCEK